MKDKFYMIFVAAVIFIVIAIYAIEIGHNS